MAQIAMNDVLSALFAYWRAKRGIRAMPARADIDPAEIPALLPHLQLIERQDGRYRFRLAGSAVADAYGRDPTGKFLDELISHDRLSIARRAYDTAFERARPLVTRNRFITPGGSALAATRVILPLSKDGVRVDMLLAGLALEHDPHLFDVRLGASTRVDPAEFQMEFLEPPP